MARWVLAFLSLLLLMAVHPCAAHAQADAPPTSGQPVQAATGNSAQPAPAKKVWTNDDVSGLREQSVVSTVGASSAKTAGRKPVSKGKDASWYREQINKLAAKIPPLDSQIAELQAVIDGKPTGDGKESARPRAVRSGSWPAEMESLQKRRDDVLNQISALYDEARHNGVPAAALPPQP